jgi:transcriptional regulator with XRE-family HTH domain
MSGRGALMAQVLRGPDRAELDRMLWAFGENVRSLRGAAGLSQVQLGARCFLPDGGISQIERGSVAPNLLILLWLARALGVSVGALADELETPSLSVSRGEILALLAREPLLDPNVVAATLDLPYSYVLRIVRYLDAYGEIVRKGGGWHLAPGRASAA